MDPIASLGATGLSKNRIEALCDGVFAIAMTLMIFNIKVPEVPAVALGPHKLAHEVFILWPKFLVYLISFAMLGVYWVGHHNQYHYILRTDRAFLWMNIFFLTCVSLIPFSTGLLGRYPAEQTALVVYGLNLILVGGFLFAMWWYATRGHRLVAQDIRPEIVRLAKGRILMAPAASLVAVCVSSVSIRSSLALFILLPFLYMIPGRIDQQWIHPSRRDSR